MWRARETMVGALTLRRAGADVTAAHAEPITLRLEWRAASLMSAWRDGVELRGEIHAAGLAAHASVRGRLSLPDSHRVHYALEFVADDGTPHRFEGAKRLSLGGVPAGLSVLRGKLLTGQGDRVGEVELRSDLQHDLIGFLRSIERGV